MISISSSSQSSNLVDPSRLTHGFPLPYEPDDAFIVITDDPLRISGLKESECGAIGVRHIAGSVTSSRDPPAARLYAVDPVGVEIRTPSPTRVVKKWPLIRISIFEQLGLGPRPTTTSLRTWMFLISAV